jgi:transposase
VRHKSNESITNQQTVSHRAFHGRLLFWGCISGSSGPGPLVFINGTMKSLNYVQTLEEYLLLYHVICLPNGGKIFKQDNTLCHQSLSTMAFLEEHNINTMPWPPYFLDLNMIENLWEIMKRKIHRKPYTGQTLIQAVQEM